MSKRVVRAWHFVGDTLRDGRPVPADGETLVHPARVQMYSSGLHASRKITDALKYARGSTICRVECSGDVVESDDELVASRRVILWRVDGEPVLRQFARDCALDVLHLWAREDISGIDVVVEYLLTGDESLRDAAWDAARSAARDAAWDAAWDAARDAAWAAAWAAARDAAWAAARAAAWAAAWAAARSAARAVARSAARDAAWDAAWSAARDVAWDAARSAARDAAWDAARALQEQRLLRLAKAARR
jgi:hypothetical protein